MFCFRHCLTLPKFSNLIISFKHLIKIHLKHILKILSSVELVNSHRKKQFSQMFMQEDCFSSFLSFEMLLFFFFFSSGIHHLLLLNYYCLFYSSFEDKCDCIVRTFISCLGKWNRYNDSYQAICLPLCKLLWLDSRELLLLYQPSSGWMNVKIMR